MDVNIGELKGKMEAQWKDYCDKASSGDVPGGHRLQCVDCNSVKVKAFGYIENAPD